MIFSIHSRIWLVYTLSFVSGRAKTGGIIVWNDWEHVSACARIWIEDVNGDPPKTISSTQIIYWTLIISLMNHTYWLSINTFTNIDQPINIHLFSTIWTTKKNVQTAGDFRRNVFSLSNVGRLDVHDVVSHHLKGGSIPWIMGGFKALPTLSYMIILIMNRMSQWCLIHIHYYPLLSIIPLPHNYEMSAIPWSIHIIPYFIGLTILDARQPVRLVFLSHLRRRARPRSWKRRADRWRR